MCIPNRIQDNTTYCSLSMLRSNILLWKPKKYNLKHTSVAGRIILKQILEKYEKTLNRYMKPKAVYNNGLLQVWLRIIKDLRFSQQWSWSFRSDKLCCHGVSRNISWCFEGIETSCSGPNSPRSHILFTQWHKITMEKIGIFKSTHCWVPKE